MKRIHSIYITIILSLYLIVGIQLDPASAQPFIWIQQFGGSQDDEASAQAVDVNGNIYVAGMTGSTLPGQSSSGGCDAFVRKYDADGNEVWTRQFGTSVIDYAKSISVDSTGVYVAGYTDGTLPYQSSSGGRDAFVRKYDADGNEFWTRQFGTSFIDFASSISADSTGVYVAGGIWPGSPEFCDAFVRRYDPAGSRGPFLMGLGEPSEVWDVRADGWFFVGFGGDPEAYFDREAHIWTKVTQYDEWLVAGMSLGKGRALGISEDNVIGYRPTLENLNEACVWTREQNGQWVATSLGLGIAKDVSADGSVIVGHSIYPAGGFDACVWTKDQNGQWVPTDLGDLPGGVLDSSACGVSADGSVIVGYGSVALGTLNEAFVWTRDQNDQWVATGLGDLPGGVLDSSACDVSADGSVIVGYGSSDNGREAFIWDATHGMRSLEEVLVNDYGHDPTGWKLRSAEGVSADGLTIVGNGISPDGSWEGWVVDTRVEDWTRQSGHLGDDHAESISVDSTGVYVAGVMCPGYLCRSESFDAFVRKHDAYGYEVWTRQFGTPVEDCGYSISVDSSGVYVAGYTDGTLPGQSSSGGRDAFARKYDADGIEVMTQQFGTPVNDCVYSISVDPDFVYVTGYTDGALPGQSSSGGRDAFVACIPKENFERPLLRVTAITHSPTSMSSADLLTTESVMSPPAYLLVTDPDGLRVGVVDPSTGEEVNEVDGATYSVTYPDPDSVLQEICIPYPEVGTYSVSVTPHPDALPTDTYGLTLQMGDASFTLADNMQIGDIPDEPYSVETTDAGINCAPIAYSDDPYQGSEGSPITLNASNSYDPDGGSLQYRWDLDSDGTWDTESTEPTAVYNWGDNYYGSVKLEVSDGELTSIDTASAAIDNVAPTVGDITAPVDPVQAGIAISASAGFTDPGVLDTHTATWNWGDGNTSPGTITKENGSGSVSGIHTYTITGVYTVGLTVTDDDGGSGESTFQYVVVYNPEGGFVTGGGWIMSPEGAYASDPSLTGKANFGFVSKYKKGADAPTGNTEFNFHVADMDFHSASYDWLVIAGAKAMFKGVGTINGNGNYGFMLSAIDADLTPSTDVDLFRIKICDRDDNDAVVYDNQMGQDDDDDPATGIGGGSIVIHEGKAAAPPQIPSRTHLLACFPCPGNPEVWIPYQLSSDSQVVIRIYAVSGRLVRMLDLGYKPAGFYDTSSKAAYWDGSNEAGERVASGIYFYAIQAGDYTAMRKLVIAK